MSLALYEALGPEAMRAAVEDLYERLLADPVTGPHFRHVELSSLRRHQAAFLSQALGGPRTYEGRELADAHAGRDIDDVAFDRVIDHLAAVLRTCGLDLYGVVAVAATLESTRPAVTGRVQGIDTCR